MVGIRRVFRRQWRGPAGLGAPGGQVAFAGAVWWEECWATLPSSLLWILTRTVGTLVGPEPHTPEAVGVPDTIASGLELAIVLVALTYAAARRPNRALAWGIGGITFVVTAVALLSIMAVATAVIPADGMTPCVRDAPDRGRTIEAL